MSRTPQDPELEGLFADDPDLGQLAHLLRSVPHLQPEPDPAFRAVLRRRLMREAWEMHEQQQQPKLPWYRRLFAGPSMAWAGGVVGVLLIALAAVLFSNYRPNTTGVAVYSPMANVQTVPVAQPIQLHFSQPMDRTATEQAIQIHPATRVAFQWPSASTVDITPVNGSLAPATRYQVTVTASAKTSAGQAVAAASTLSFVTAPPTPSGPPSTTPPPGPVVNSGSRLANLNKLGLAGDQPAAWSLDGRLLYVIGAQGQLRAYSVTGGAPQQIAPDGVQMVVAGPAGPAYARNGDLVYNGQTLSGANPLAIGFNSGRLLYISGNQVLGADHSAVAALNGQPSAASFAPGGSRLAYIDSSGLHLLDLTTSKDQLVPNVSSLGAWPAAGGVRYAYPTGSAVVIMNDAGAATQVHAAGVTDLSWSRDGRLLLAGPNGLYLVSAAGGDPSRLSAAETSQPLWSPAGGNLLSYKQDGWVWTAQVVQGQQALSQDDVVSAFFSARRDRDATQASTYLDDAGKTAFNSLTLVYGGGQVLTRYQILLEEPGRVVVRLVTTQSGVDSAVDETLVLRRDAQGRMLIHGASDASPRPLGRGPEVVLVQLTGSQVQVTFDSDLDPSTIGGVTVAGLSGSASYDRRSRTVTIGLGQPLDSGSNYQLQVSDSLHDVGKRAALPFSLTFVGPPAAATPTPSPSPSPTNSPTPSPSPTAPPASPSPTSS